MTLFLESLRSALASIRAHRLRSFLTSLGIVIGVASVITVVSLIQGLSKSVSDQFSGLGGNGLTVKAHFEFKDAMRGKIGGSERRVVVLAFHREIAGVDAHDRLARLARERAAGACQVLQFRFAHVRGEKRPAKYSRVMNSAAISRSGRWSAVTGSSRLARK